VLASTTLSQLQSNAGVSLELESLLDEQDIAITIIADNNNFFIIFSF
jgi:hypothetical protein